MEFFDSNRFRDRLVDYLVTVPSTSPLQMYHSLVTTTGANARLPSPPRFESRLPSFIQPDRGGYPIHPFLSADILSFLSLGVARRKRR